MAAQLDDQPSGTVQRAGQRKSLRMGIWTVYGCAGRLYQETDERMYRKRDYRRMAVSPGRSNRQDRGTGREQCCLRTDDDAVYHCIFHAKNQR